MAAWAGVAVALRRPEQDELRSRLPTHLHPLAGRPVAWHVLRAMIGGRGGAERVALLTDEGADRAVAGEIPADVLHPGESSWVEDLPPEVQNVLVVDAAAAALEASLRMLARSEPPSVLSAADGAVLALLLPRRMLRKRAIESALTDPPPEAKRVGAVDEELFLVRDRMTLSRATAIVRDRTIQRLMRDGVTFLLPSSVVVDVDVRVGRDTVIYPGVMLEGSTTIGSESVIGPGCRIVDSRVGNGVELKGWNYVAGTSIRNRAVVEPYVRRGFD